MRSIVAPEGGSLMLDAVDDDGAIGRFLTSPGREGRLRAGAGADFGLLLLVLLPPVRSIIVGVCFFFCSGC